MSDLISRQEAIDALETIGYDFSDSGLSEIELEEVCEAVCDVRQDMIGRIKQLPSAQSERKTGHWIEHKTQIADHAVYTYECSECGHSMLVKPTRFCGHCGLKMEEANDDSE